MGALKAAVNTNLFGVACPFNCTGPSVGLSLSGFLLGFLCGVGFCAWILFRFDFVTSSRSIGLPLHLQQPPLLRPLLTQVIHVQSLPPTCMSNGHGDDVEI